MSFHLFVLPFSIGLLFLCAYLLVYYTRLIKSLSQSDKALIASRIFTKDSLNALGEVFMESLLHRKVFKKNVLLGYMHMSFALGWFLLIVMGNVESRVFSLAHVNPPYYPIFLKFFMHDTKILYFEVFTLPGFFRFVMDLLLLFVLSGLILAFVKRFRSNWFGMRHTTKLRFFDKAALYSLWLIFPCRLFAESITASIYGSGGFLTGGLGMGLSEFLPVKLLFLPSWWAYSIVLGVFFVSLPWSRYMHIPTEVVLIFLRKYGVSSNGLLEAYAQLQLMSCSRCGLCLDVCQMLHPAQKKQTQAVHFLQGIRHQTNDFAFTCLMCNRCTQVCPVGIEITNLRQAKRALQLATEPKQDYSYLKPIGKQNVDYIYFAGCMGRLNPSTTQSMRHIFERLKLTYWFVDELDSFCCGRPLELAGKLNEAQQLIHINTKMFQDSGAHTLITSCPICLRTFKDKYGSAIRFVHHSQFINELLEQKRIEVVANMKKVAYHDPCELGRGLGIYEEPRKVLQKCGKVVEAAHSKHEALCCGGSLGDFGLTTKQKDLIANATVSSLAETGANTIVTACPLCKKTLAKHSPHTVYDIAELVEKQMV